MRLALALIRLSFRNRRVLYYSPRHILLNTRSRIRHCVPPGILVSNSYFSRCAAPCQCWRGANFLARMSGFEADSERQRPPNSVAKVAQAGVLNSVTIHGLSIE